MIEISTIPLLVFDLFKQFPEMKTSSELVRQIDEWSRLVFGILFIFLRCVLWPRQVLKFLMDLHTMWHVADVQNSSMRLITFAVNAVLLSVLQMFWAKKVIRGFMRRMRKEKM